MLLIVEAHSCNHWTTKEAPRSPPEMQHPDLRQTQVMTSIILDNDLIFRNKD